MALTTRMTYALAAGEALAAAMRADARVVAVGEDLGRGGVFGQYRTRAPDGSLRPLQQEFGGARVIDTPISKSLSRQTRSRAPVENANELKLTKIYTGNDYVDSFRRMDRSLR